MQPCQSVHSILDRLPYREKIFVYERILMKFTGSVQQPITHLLCEFDENRPKIAKMFFILVYFLVHLRSIDFFYQASPLFFFSKNNGLHEVSKNVFKMFGRKKTFEKKIKIQISFKKLKLKDLLSNFFHFHGILR